MKSTLASHPTKHALQPFKDGTPMGVGVDVVLSRDKYIVDFEFIVHGLDQGILWPAAKLEGQRRDGIFYSSCCELFFAYGEYYVEYNFAPNLDWCGYAFAGYRHALPIPNQAFQPEAATVAVDAQAGKAYLAGRINLEPTLATLTSKLDGQPIRTSATAILNIASENTYWAVAHMDSKPDFHRLDSFQITI